MIQILMPFRNVAPWLRKSINSIQDQTVKDWSCYLIDDGATDGSDQIAKEISKADKRFIYCCPMRLENHKWTRYRAYQLGCYQFAYRMGRGIIPQDICVSIDGDDWLPDQFVFQRVCNAYSSPETWLTYGSYVLDSGELGRCNSPTDPKLIRSMPHTASALKTWKSFLFDKIRLEDFYGPDGEPLRAAGDTMIMMAMVEMAGSHAVYMPEINYVYNKQNPESNFRIRREEQMRNYEYLRALPSYEPLKDVSCEF